MFRNLLQGRPFGHPLHPMIVHLPIGLWMLSFVFDIASRIADDGNWLVRGAYYTMVAGTIGALLAASPGFADFSDMPRDRRGRRVAVWHMVLNLAAVVLYLINIWLRRDDLDRAEVASIPVILSLLDVGLVIVSGYLGWIMLYSDGIGVGRHRRKTSMREEMQSTQVIGAPPGGRGTYI